MIALHSGALIAPFDANDAHHSKAETPFTTHISEPMTIGPINLAEVLISASRENRDHEMLADLRPLDVTTTPLPDDAATRLARLRAITRSKMPDCCVLLTAEQTSARIATFDEGLKASARALSIETI